MARAVPEEHRPEEQVDGWAERWGCARTWGILSRVPGGGLQGTQGVRSQAQRWDEHQVAGLQLWNIPHAWHGAGHGLVWQGGLAYLETAPPRASCVLLAPPPA